MNTNDKHQAQQEIENDQQIFQSLLNQLLTFKENIIASLNKIIQLILEQIQLMQKSKNQLATLIYQDQSESVINNQQQFVSSQQSFNKDMKIQIEQQLKGFQSQFSNIENLLATINNCQKVEQKTEQNMIQNYHIVDQNLEKSKKISYELINELVMIEDFTYSFAFNKDNTLLIIGCLQEIIVYNFINGKILKEIQRLQNHKHHVYCLQFMKLSNSFISGSKDKQIIIWKLDQNNQWVPQQILKEHKQQINCLLVNRKEDLIVSGSKDQTIKIWIKQAESWKCFQSILTKYETMNLSLNEREDKLITSQNNFQQPGKSCIQVLTLQQNQQWDIVQKIDFSGLGWRLCFTIGDQFIYATQDSDEIYIYDYDTKWLKFEKALTVKIQGINNCTRFFPCKYIKQLNLLVFKRGQQVDIIKINENNDFHLIQTIQYNDVRVYGGVSDDGQYLITWEFTSNEIQIRELKFIE